MISGALTETCGSQKSFDKFDELQHSLHKVLPLQARGEEVFAGAGGQWELG